MLLTRYRNEWQEYLSKAVDDHSYLSKIIMKNNERREREIKAYEVDPTIPFDQ
jgi:hypothetical protein